MQSGRDRDDDRVEVRAGQQGGDIRSGLDAVLRGDPLRGLGVLIGDGDEIGRGVLRGEPLDMALADDADSDDAESLATGRGGGGGLGYDAFLSRDSVIAESVATGDSRACGERGEAPLSTACRNSASAGAL